MRLTDEISSTVLQSSVQIVSDSCHCIIAVEHSATQSTVA